MSVCKYIYIYIYILVSLFNCEFGGLYMCVYTYIYIYIYIYIHTYIHMYVGGLNRTKYICTYVCLAVCFYFNFIFYRWWTVLLRCDSLRSGRDSGGGGGWVWKGAAQRWDPRHRPHVFRVLSSRWPSWGLVRVRWRCGARQWACVSRVRGNGVKALTRPIIRSWAMSQASPSPHT